MRIKIIIKKTFICVISANGAYWRHQLNNIIFQDRKCTTKFIKFEFKEYIPFKSEGRGKATN